MCRALKVLCIATDAGSLASLRAATVSAEWELVPGATSEAEAFDVIDAERPHVLVAFGPYERLVSLVRERFPGMRIVVDRDMPGADAVVGVLEQVRASVKGGPRPAGPVTPADASSAAACEDGHVSGTVILASPRGYCAGVDRAVEAVERALAKHGAPVYVRKQIVHNLHVVKDLEARGAVFVDEETDVPEGAVVVLSAHGVAPEVYEHAASRRLEVIDATCPLVTKVHVEARRFASQDRTIVLIGHAGHEEVVGTTGQAPERTILVQSADEARTVEVPDPRSLSYLTQTTLSVEETDEIVRILRERFPAITGPPRDDICYATQNRQDAVKVIAPRSDVVLVIGSKNSSNSTRLAELSVELGTPAHLVDDETAVDPSWLVGASTVGLTSGASAPEWLVRQMLAWLAERGFDEVEEVTLTEERVRFSLPAGVRGPALAG
jgi:4-hydroxy-3-methylbut-2-enyl diphosphate reductase